MNHIQTHALAFMASKRTITLALQGPDGLDISSFPYVLADEFDFFIISDTHDANTHDLELASRVVGIIRGDGEGPGDNLEIRLEGAIERVRDLTEQAKAFSAFLIHDVPLPKSPPRNGDSRVLAVYRVRPARVQVAAPSLMKHTAVFHLGEIIEAGIAPSQPAPAKPRESRRMGLSNGRPMSLRDRPTFRELGRLNGQTSLQPRS